MPNFVKIGQLSVFVNIFLVGSMMGPQRRKGLRGFLEIFCFITLTSHYAEAKVQNNDK